MKTYARSPVSSSRKIARLRSTFGKEWSDSFLPAQMKMGPFYGLFEDEDLVSMAGVHIQSHWASVAAIGNVYTRPDRRGRGFATQVTASVIEDVLSQGIETVVLNVGRDNQPALTCYRKLGFWPYCGYYEGTGTLSGTHQKIMES